MKIRTENQFRKSKFGASCCPEIDLWSLDFSNDLTRRMNVG
jgi:hypothetical protein